MFGNSPSLVTESLWQMPQACTLIRTVLGPGSGIGRSTISKGPFGRETCATRIVAIFPSSGGTRGWSASPQRSSYVSDRAGQRNPACRSAYVVNPHCEGRLPDHVTDASATSRIIPMEEIWRRAGGRTRPQRAGPLPTTPLQVPAETAARDRLDQLDLLTSPAVRLDFEPASPGQESR